MASGLRTRPAADSREVAADDDRGTGEIVGRDGEIAAARAFLASVPDGPRALLIEGELGIGKTALWRAVLAEAAVDKVRVLSCVAVQAEARLSFVGLGDLVRDVGEGVRHSLSGLQREALEIALLERPSASGRAPDAMTMGAALRSVLVAVARDNPVVVAVDDVQWLDTETARALAFAARRLDGLPVALLTTVRVPHATPDVLGLERAFGSENLSRIRLEPFNLGSVRALVARQLGYCYSRPTLLRVAETSGGNPLFALEIARALGPEPSLQAGAPLPVPDSLRELVAGRVAALPTPARRSLLVASALSQPSEEMVERASSATGIAAAEEAGILRVENGRIAFAHPLYASAVYTSASSRRRRELHLKLSELASEPEEQVRHLALATSQPDEDVAAALEEVATLARERGAWESAGELLEQARALTPAVQVDAAQVRGVRAAEHYIHAGDRPRARALLEQILPDTPPGPTRSDGLRLLAEVRYNDYSFAEAAQLLEEALENAEDPVLAVTIEMNLAFVHSQSGRFGEADVHAARALERAERLGNPAYLGAPLAVSAHIGFINGRGIDWRKIERAVELERPEHLVPLLFRPSLIAAMSKLFAGELDDAREQFAAVRLAWTDARDESDIALVIAWQAWLETQAGNLDTAVALADEAYLEAELTGSESSRAWALAMRAVAHAQRGDVPAARADASAAAETAHGIKIVPPLIMATAAVGVLELSLGDPAAAWTAVAPMLEQVEVHGIGEVMVVLYLPEALEALIALGELERVEKLLENFEARASELDRPWALFTSARARALLLAERGDLDGAMLAVERALLAHERSEMPFERARTLLVQGQVMRRRRERRAARESVEQALELFERLGAAIWAERARGELNRLGSRASGTDLTESESRVVDLAIHGLSNKAIAARLFVGVHTVEVHLSHAYVKLGIRSRSQLAQAMSRRT